MISQIYGGGGNSGALYKNDFIEVFNRGVTPVDLAGWSVQYNSATATTAWSVTPLCATGTCLLQPGQYFLVHEAAGSGGSANLPAPDATGTIAMTAGTGKVALVNNTTALSGACPSGASIADLIGYGSAASTTNFCFEGAGPAAAPGNTTAVFRKGGGCVDTNDNAADSFVHTTVPRNTSSPLSSCAGGRSTDIVVDDVTVTEGNTGAVAATFTVSLLSPSTSTVTVDYRTANGSATEPADYEAVPLTTLTFTPDQISKTVTVMVNGDTIDEPDETFFLNLSNATNAAILDGQGVGTITDDDVPPTLSINDMSTTEGNSGTKLLTFTVSLSAPALTGGVTFDITTADNTATVADNDYIPRSLTNQMIPTGQQSYTFDVTVNGDVNIEANEQFFVNVTNVAGATLVDGQGVGTIQNDDSPVLSINDGSANETNSGTTTFNFTVTSSLPAPAGGITFDIATQDGSATTANNDYVSNSLNSQTIPAGQTTYNFSVTVRGDTIVEPNETFVVNLSNVLNATISDSQGLGTIQNDDTPILVISQVYGGGGNSGAAFLNDFVQIFNRGTSIIDFTITAYSLQYASSAGNFTAANKTDITTGTLVPGQYLLIKLGTSGANGTSFTADITNTGINMSSTDGKVALVVGTALATTAAGCPTAVTVADLLGYGSANCSETTATPSLNATKVATRNGNGCHDTNVNTSDFSVATVNTSSPVPKNSSEPPSPCP